MKYPFMTLLLCAPLWVHSASVPAASAPAGSHASLLAYPMSKITASDGEATYYVEADGRHVAALSHKGRLLWRTEIIPPGYICTPGSAVVRHVQVIGDKISVTFCKHSFGELDRASGQYNFLGQD